MTTILAWATFVGWLLALAQGLWRRVETGRANTERLARVAAEKETEALKADLLTARARVGRMEDLSNASLAKVMALQGALVAKMGHDEAQETFARLFGGK